MFSTNLSSHVPDRFMNDSLTRSDRLIKLILIFFFWHYYHISLFEKPASNRSVKSKLCTGIGKAEKKPSLHGPACTDQEPHILYSFRRENLERKAVQANANENQLILAAEHTPLITSLVLLPPIFLLVQIQNRNHSTQYQRKRASHSLGTALSSR